MYLVTRHDVNGRQLSKLEYVAKHNLWLPLCLQEFLGGDLAVTREEKLERRHRWEELATNLGKCVGARS